MFLLSHEPLVYSFFMNIEEKTMYPIFSYDLTILYFSFNSIFLVMYDKFFLILFKKIGILMKNKIINLLFKSDKSDKSKVIHEDGNKIGYTFHNIILKIKLFS